MTSSDPVATIAFSRTHDASRLARRAFAPMLAGYDPAFADHVLIAMSELVTNVVRHTPDGHGRASLFLDGDVARVEVSDHDPRVPTICADPPTPWQTDGRGLYVVSQLAIRLAVDASVWGKTISATIRA